LKRKKMKLFSRRKAVVPLPEPHVLTGIEKYWLEEDLRRTAAAEIQRKKDEARIFVRIAEIELEIAPQLQELAVLRQQLPPTNPLLNYLQQAGAAMAGQAIGPSGYPAFDSRSWPVDFPICLPL
jgi:hypothetical protein